MASGFVPGFLPSISGLKFPNHYPSGVPVKSIALPAIGKSIPLGDASNGVCGGMVYTALDFFMAKPRAQVPADTSPPPSSSALTQHVLDRLVDSFALEHGLSSNVARYLSLMSTPDSDLFLVHGVPSIIAHTEWPKIKQDIDAGRPSPLGLVGGERVWPTDLSAKVSMLGHCHQVLAYAYELDDNSHLTLHVYDSNDPGRNDSTIEMSLASPSKATSISMSRITSHISGHGTFRAFFRHNYYAPVALPAGVSPGPVPV